MGRRSRKYKFDFRPIGQEIKQAREARKMSRERVAEIVDYVPRHIQALENKGQTPSVDLLFQLATMFGISLDRHIFKDSGIKSSVRRRVDMLLDGLSDKDLIIIEATATAIHSTKEPPEESEK